MEKVNSYLLAEKQGTKEEFVVVLFPHNSSNLFTLPLSQLYFQMVLKFQDSKK